MLQRPCARVECSRSSVRTTNTYVFFIATFSKARCPWQSTAPIGGSSDLPSPNEQILESSCVSSKWLPFAERKFVDSLSNPDVVTNLVIGPIRDWVADCVVVGIVLVCVS